MGIPGNFKSREPESDLIGRPVAAGKCRSVERRFPALLTVINIALAFTLQM
jgi:hypothetical protein